MNPKQRILVTGATGYIEKLEAVKAS